MSGVSVYLHVVFFFKINFEHVSAIRHNILKINIATCCHSISKEIRLIRPSFLFSLDEYCDEGKLVCDNVSTGYLVILSRFYRMRGAMH